MQRNMLNFSYCFQLGPRIRFQLVKIEEGLCSGEVLFHEFGEIDKGLVSRLLKIKKVYLIHCRILHAL